MADGTKIEWTDATWNPITGCQVKSPGCKFCYAMKLAGTRLKHHPSREGLTVGSKNGPVWTGEVRFNEEWLTQPLQWSRPRMIFVCAHADLFYEAVPDEWIDRVFAVMALAPQHTFQVLTKRPDRMASYLGFAGKPGGVGEGRMSVRNRIVMERVPVAHHAGMRQWFNTMPWPLPNVWLGTSVEDQERADERRAPLAELAARGWTTWVSYEPALGPVNWSGWEFLEGFVSGGESDMDGHSARPSHPDWQRTARDFCSGHDIAYGFKQWGSWAPACHMTDRDADALFTKGAECRAEELVLRFDGTTRPISAPDAFLAGHRAMTMFRIGKGSAGRLLDGRTHDDFPLQLLARKAASA